VHDFVGLCRVFECTSRKSVVHVYEHLRDVHVTLSDAHVQFQCAGEDLLDFTRPYRFVELPFI
jgi:hypothetical protein